MITDSVGKTYTHRMSCKKEKDPFQQSYMADHGTGYDRLDQHVFERSRKMAGLFAAVRAGDFHEVSRILSDPENSRLVNNPSDHNETALHLAAEVGDLVICQRLLAAGARCDVPNAQKHTPLHRAAFRGHYHIIKLLLSTLYDTELQLLDWP